MQSVESVISQIHNPQRALTLAATGIKFPLNGDFNDLALPDVVRRNLASIQPIQELFEALFDSWEKLQDESPTPRLHYTCAVEKKIFCCEPAEYAERCLKNRSISEAIDQLRLDLSESFSVNLPSWDASSLKALQRILRATRSDDLSAQDLIGRGVTTGFQMVFGLILVASALGREKWSHLEADTIKEKICETALNSTKFISQLANVGISEFMNWRCIFKDPFVDSILPSSLLVDAFSIMEREEGPSLTFSEAFLREVSSFEQQPKQPYTGCPATKVKISGELLIPKLMQWAVKIYKDFFPAEYIVTAEY